MKFYEFELMRKAVMFRYLSFYNIKILFRNDGYTKHDGVSCSLCPAG
jgi:hypothetical protein